MGLGKVSGPLVYFTLLALTLILHPSHAQDLKQDYVNAHNAAREQVGVGPVTWDENVAAYAQSHANNRIGDCSGVLSGGGQYGETIAWNSTGDLSGVDAVRSWISQKLDYNYNSNTCAPGMECTSYTQVVWRGSVKIGCAKVRCNNGGTFITCNYDPHGNIPGQRPY